MTLAGLIGAAGLLTIAGVLVHFTATVAGQATESANFEGAQTNPIRLSSDGTRLFAVNTANNSLSVFDVSNPTAPALIREIPVGLEPVSVNPRTRDEAWVVNQLSDSVSIASVSQGIVTSTLNAEDEPMDVVFAGTGQAYVSLSRSNAVGVYDTTTGAMTMLVRLFGANPRALAVSTDGSAVYAAFALSGNGTTIIPDSLAPPQPPPTNPALPPPPQVAKIVAATDPQWSSVVTYKMPDNDVAIIRTGASPTVAGYVSGVGTINLGLAVNPTNGDVWVANTNARNLVSFEPNLRGHWVDNRLTKIARTTGVVTPFDLNPNIDYSILPNPAARATALAQPTAVAFDPSGGFMYVAAFGTDRVAQVDTSGNVLSFVEVSPPSGSGSLADPKNKRGPRGLALQKDGRTLYVLNRISNTISIVNTTSNTVIAEIPVGTDLTPTAERVGRGFLYDAKLSGNGTGACASCHVDGDMDMIAWDLGDPGGNMTTFVDGSGQSFTVHPMKGPMMTQSLRGLPGTGRFHWRGDKADFLAFNGAFDSLMGGSQLSTSDMQAYAAFVNTLLYQPNPFELLNRTAPATIGLGRPAVGKQVFMTVAGTFPNRTCTSCHAENPGPGTNGLMSPDSAIRLQPLKTPQLRNEYQKLLFTNNASSTIAGFGLDHPGHVSSFNEFFKSRAFAGYTTQQKADLSAYMLSFDTGTAPAVGHTVTLSRASLGNAQFQSDWTTLEQQAQAGNIGLVVHGTINGRVSTLVYQPSLNNYLVQSTAGTVTRQQLQILIGAGDTLSVMGVAPPGLTPAGALSLMNALSGGGGSSAGH